MNSFLSPCSITNIFWTPIAKIKLNPVINPNIKYVILSGAARETRTLTGNSHLALNQACLPISAWPHVAQ